MKHFILIIVTMFLFGTSSLSAQSANEQAIAHYREAQRAYQIKDYNRTLASLQEAVKLLENTNARIEVLRIKAYTDMGSIRDARKSLHTFLDLPAEYALYQEIDPYIVRIEQAEQKAVETEIQAMQQEAEQEETVQRLYSILAQIPASIEEDRLDEATRLLAQAKQLSAADSEGQRQVNNMEIYLAEIKEEKSLYQQVLTGALVAMRDYLNKFAHYPNASKVSRLLQEKETAAYQVAVASDTFADYKRFLADFGDSNRATEVRQLAAVAEEREAYQFFLANSTTSNAYTYLHNFPKGVHHALVMATYDELLYADGLEYERVDNWVKAKEIYSSYRYVFPEGKHVAQVDRKLRKIDKKIARQSTLNKIDARTYLLLSYANNGTYGVELGRLPGGRGVGGYIAGQVNGAGLKVGKTTGTIAQEEVDASDSYQVGVLAGSIGINYCITYPVWLYGGAGVSYQPYYDKNMEQSLTLEGRKDLVFFPEVGIKTRLGGVLLKVGIQVIPGGTTYQFGIGF